MFDFTKYYMEYCWITSASDSNGDAWRDKYGITYIIFTIEEIMNLMNLGNKKVNKMLKELEEHGLIYRRHQGLGRPNKI